MRGARGNGMFAVTLITYLINVCGARPKRGGRSVKFRGVVVVARERRTGGDVVLSAVEVEKRPS